MKEFEYFNLNINMILQNGKNLLRKARHKDYNPSTIIVFGIEEF